jgi:transposase
MPAEVSEMARKRRTFSPEFKEETVALVLDKGMSMRQVAHDLDIGESVIGRWVKQAKVDRGDNPRGDLTTEEKEELRKLRRENKILKEEREILKKAAAFFAKETQ